MVYIPVIGQCRLFGSLVSFCLCLISVSVWDWKYWKEYCFISFSSEIAIIPAESVFCLLIIFYQRFTLICVVDWSLVCHCLFCCLFRRGMIDKSFRPVSVFSFSFILGLSCWILSQAWSKVKAWALVCHCMGWPLTWMNVVPFRNFKFPVSCTSLPCVSESVIFFSFYIPSVFPSF